MKISQFFQPVSQVSGSGNRVAPRQTEGSPDLVSLSGPQQTPPDPPAPASGWGKKLAHGAAKTALIVGGLAVGGLAAGGFLSMGAWLGPAGLALGALAQLSDDSKVKMTGTLLMLGSCGPVGGVLGAALSGLKVGASVMLAGLWGRDAHLLANDLLDGRQR